MPRVKVANNARQSEGFSVPCFAVWRYATAKQSTTKPQLLAALGKYMFDRINFEELCKSEGRKLRYLSGYRGLYFISYPQHAFVVPDSEEYIRITIAPKSEGDNGLLFWIAAELLDDWSGRDDHLIPYLSGSYFERINESEFNSIVAEKCKYLIYMPELPIVKDQAFLGALLMYSMRTDFLVSALAEYKDKYIHFYWETTA